MFTGIRHLLKFPENQFFCQFIFYHLKPVYMKVTVVHVMENYEEEQSKLCIELLFTISTNKIDVAVFRCIVTCYIHQDKWVFKLIFQQ